MKSDFTAYALGALLALTTGCGDDDTGNATGEPNSTTAGGNGSPGDSNDGSNDDSNDGSNDGSNDDSNSGTDGGGNGNVSVPNPLTDPAEGPPAGYADGGCDIPSEASLEDVSNPTTVVGTGTPETCTSTAVINAVAQGGVITFDCGPDPVTIMMDATAKIVNNTGPKIVIDGGGLVTLSGQGKQRILYMNTCDKDQKWTTSHCQDQDHPRLTVQNLTFVDGNARWSNGVPAGNSVPGRNNTPSENGGGAIFSRGGRLKVINSRFFNNECADVGPDIGGGAIRVFDQHDDQPVYVVNSTFGGRDGYGNSGSNGGGVSSIGVSWTIINTLFSHNSAIGNGGNPAKDGTPGGGSGGAIYNDGNRMTLSLCGVKVEHNEVNAFGSAIFFVSNNHTGNIVIRDSTITNNVDLDSSSRWNRNMPQIARHNDTPIDVTNSVVE